MGSPIEIRIGNRPLSTLAEWGNPVVTHRRVGGCWSLSWDMDVRPDWSSPFVKQGATVQAFLGTSAIWTGFLPEFDPEQGTFEAMGLGRRFEVMQAYDLSGPTNDIDDAIFFANARGSLVGSLGAFGVVADNSGEPRYISELLAMWMSENPGKFWFVDRNGTLWIGTEQSTPRWWVMPGAASLGQAYSDYATRWTVRYLDAATSTFKDASASVSADTSVERIAELTERGPISTATAQGVADGLLAASQTLTGWTNPITVTDRSLANRGGGYVGLGMVKAPDMIRLQGFRDSRRSAAYTDAVIDESVWDVEAGEITLKPVDTADRNVASIVESQGGRIVL